MDALTYTHRDLAGLLGVSETTVKSYRSKFPTFLPVAREGKPVRLHPEALAVCRRIRDLFADGLTIIQTADRLRTEFKEYPLNRRLPIAPRQAAVNGPSAGPEAGVAARLETLAQAQGLAWQRMEQLEAEVRNLATLEAASKALVAELLQELRTARAAPQPSIQPAPPPPRPEPEQIAGPAKPEAPAGHLDGPTVVTARKIVTVHGQAGPVASYALGREPRPEPPFAAPARPPAAFLDLPAVIRSDRGEFLGLPGGQSVARLVELLAPRDGDAVSWFEEAPEVWTCVAPLGPALAREVLFERTTTPRGNLVGLIRRLRTLSGSNEAEASPQELQDFFRQMRDQLG